jgi:2-methylcitrate dehydratase
LTLTESGDDFAIMNMHFKLGLYEHQSASAIQGIIELIKENKETLFKEGDHSSIQTIKITSYEPAFSIIGDASKKTPTCR